MFCPAPGMTDPTCLFNHSATVEESMKDSVSYLASNEKSNSNTKTSYDTFRLLVIFPNVLHRKKTIGPFSIG